MKIVKRAEALAEDALLQSQKAMFVGETNEKSIKVNALIREKYSISDELAILRKALAKLNIHDEQLDEYNAFVEQCKEEASKDYGL